MLYRQVSTLHSSDPSPRAPPSAAPSLPCDRSVPSARSASKHAGCGSGSHKVLRVRDVLRDVPQQPRDRGEGEGAGEEEADRLALVLAQVPRHVLEQLPRVEGEAAGELVQRVEVGRAEHLELGVDVEPAPRDAEHPLHQQRARHLHAHVHEDREQDLQHEPVEQPLRVAAAPVGKQAEHLAVRARAGHLAGREFLAREDTVRKRRVDVLQAWRAGVEQLSQLRGRCRRRRRPQRPRRALDQPPPPPPVKAGRHAGQGAGVEPVLGQAVLDGIQVRVRERLRRVRPPAAGHVAPPRERVARADVAKAGGVVRRAA
mmetsp:Transcript_1828/g.5779  ORF Transcript_1828/g.5779 Transcript_1828/m.5779 type:complete len:315 (+) Transcript_1828:197-1141(+)